MDGRKAIGKTIGEVEKLTGIPKRELKYYIEQKIMRPSQRTESGYWSYNDEDIQKVQLAALCRDLDIPVKAIRVILADPASCWPQELERQIDRLMKTRDHAERQLDVARRLRHSGVSEALQIYYSDQTKQDAALADK